MATLAVIKECLTALKERNGSSIYAINKLIESEKKVRYHQWSYRAALSKKSAKYFVPEF